MGLNTSLYAFPPARIEDLVLVENSAPGGPYTHIGIVIGVDRNDRITRIRQKMGPTANDCVKDTTAAQFQALEPLQPSEQYELWRNNAIDFLGKLAR